MGGWQRFWAIVLLLGVSGLPADAAACDVSTWSVEEQELECLELMSRDGNQGVRNTCATPVVVNVAECSFLCPAEKTLAPDEEFLLAPETPDSEQTMRVTSDAGDRITFVYRENICPPAEGDCSFGPTRRSSSWAVLALLLLTAALRRGQRSPRPAKPSDQYVHD